MSIRPDERISFVLSDLSRQQNGAQNAARRRGCDDFTTRSAAAAVVGATGAAGDFSADLESPSNRDDDACVRVDAKRPPRLRSRRAFCMTLVGIWTTVTLIVAVMLVMQVASSRYFDMSTSDSALERRLARDSTIRDTAEFGIWDSRRVVTPLQLQVVVSMALGVRAADDDVHVTAEDNFFYVVSVQHATVEEVEFIGSTGFINRLNTHLEPYGGLAVISKPPKLVKIAS